MSSFLKCSYRQLNPTFPCHQASSQGSRRCSVSSPLPLPPTSQLGRWWTLGMGTLSWRVDLSLWCKPTQSMERPTRMQVPTCNSSWRSATLTQLGESARMPSDSDYFPSPGLRRWKYGFMPMKLFWTPGICYLLHSSPSLSHWAKLIVFICVSVFYTG